LVEFNIEGEKFTLVRRLTSQELGAITRIYDKLSERELTLEEFYYQIVHARATLQKCFAMSPEELDNLSFDTFKQLYRELVEYCERSK